MNTELNGHQDAGQTPQDPPPPVSSRRRRILKLALTSAPFAITLPNGAALANISAYQCIANNRKESPLLAVTEKDKWERVAVPGYEYSVTLPLPLSTEGKGGKGEKGEKGEKGGKGSEPDELESSTPVCISQLNETRYYIGGDTSSQAYKLVGNDLKPENLPSLEEGCGTWTILGPANPNPVYVLAYWRPVNGDTDVDIPHVGIYPTYSPGLDETPLDGSCFCSVNPQATGPIGKCM